MGVTSNYIDESERKFIESNYLTSLGGLWSSSGTLAVDPVTFQDSAFGSLKLSDGTTASMEYNIWPTPATDVPSQYAITTIADNNDTLETFCWVKPTSNCVVTLKTTLTLVTYDISTQKYMLSTDVNDVYEGQEGEHRIDVGVLDDPKWHLVRAVPIFVPSGEDVFSVGFTLSVEFSNPLISSHINVSRPTVIKTHQITRNRAMMQIAQNIPTTYLERDSADATSTKPTYPLLRLIDTATSALSDIYDEYDNYVYIDASDGFDAGDLSTYSTLVGSELAPLNTLEWLSQFRGRELIVTYEPSTNGAAWEAFVLDESDLDSDDVLSTTSTATTGLSGGVEEYFRWQVETGNYGHNAGTLDSMIEAIKFLLIGTKTVNYTMTANTIHFETDINETYGGDDQSVGDESPFVIALVEPCRPLGMVVTHELI